MRRILSALLAVTLWLPSLWLTPLQAAGQDAVEQSTWSVGDWWEFEGAKSGSYRLTVVGRDKDEYVLVSTPRGVAANPDRPGVRLHAEIDGWLRARVAANGKRTEFPRFEFVKFPLKVGNRWWWSAEEQSVTGGRFHYDWDSHVAGWEDITIAGRTARALRIESWARIRGYSNSWLKVAWYVPEAKRIVRLAAQYAGADGFEITAWSVGGVAAGIAPTGPSAATSQPAVAVPQGGGQRGPETPVASRDPGQSGPLPEPRPVIWSPGSPLPVVRRGGLPPRSQEESEEIGQLTRVEVEALRQKAVKFQKRIVLTGGLTETNKGLAKRYVIGLIPMGDSPLDPRAPVRRSGVNREYAASVLGVPDYRTLKPQSDLIDTGVGDVDIYLGAPELKEQEKLTPEEIAEIRRDVFPDSKVDDTGYSAELYKTEDDLPGAIVFQPGGPLKRILAPHQK